MITSGNYCIFVIIWLFFSNYFLNILLDLRMVSGIARNPVVHFSGLLVCSIRTSWRVIQQQQTSYKRFMHTSNICCVPTVQRQIIVLELRKCKMNGVCEGLCSWRMNINASTVGNPVTCQSGHYILASTDVVVSEHLPHPGIRTPDVPALCPKIWSIRIR